MENIFEITDKTKRKIRLSKRIWSKIRRKHYEIENEEQIKEALTNPDKIEDYNESVAYYYKYYKNKPLPKRFLLVPVKHQKSFRFLWL